MRFRSVPVIVMLAVLLTGRMIHAAEESIPAIPLPQIPARTFSIIDYGATAEGRTLNTDAIKKTIDACAKAGGGIIDVPAGRFLTAAFSLGSRMNLHLAKGAVILLSNRFDDYHQSARGGYENQITATDAQDVAITGEGSIDGQGQPWWDEILKRKGAQSDSSPFPHRPYMVVLQNCTRVLVQGVTLTNSPSFHLVPAGCRDVTIKDVNFVAPAKAPNTDALDPSGWNFLITGCTFDVGDDCIAIKPGGQAKDGHLSCEDFFITDCTFKHGHGMSIGGQSRGGLRHLLVRDCTFADTEAGIRMKANRGNGGLVENCVYENLSMKNVRVPIYLTSYYPEHNTPKQIGDDKGQPVDKLTPIWRDIHITNLTAVGSAVAGRMVGVPEMPIADVVLTNVRISAEMPLQIWNAKGIRFVQSRVSVVSGDALDVEQAEVSGIDLKTGVGR